MRTSSPWPSRPGTPSPKPRKALPQKRTLMPLLANEDKAILLYRRPSSGLWGGLWSLPEVDDLGEQLFLSKHV